MELGLLNSELGRLALSSSMMQCIIGWMMLIASNVFKHGSVSLMNGLYSLLSFSALAAFILLVIRPYARNIVRTTLPYARVRELHILVIMLAVLVLGFISDFIGFTYPDAPIIMGLIVPQGPPLGTALIERVDLVASEVLLPLVFVREGFNIDWAEVKQKLSLVLMVEIIVLATFITKICANIAAAVYCKMSWKEGVLLGLMMNFRGLIDMLNFLNMTGGKLIDNATYTVLVLSTIAISAICVPLVSIYYKPLGVKNHVGRRTVQRLRSHVEVRVMTCFYDDSPIPALLEFLESISSEETGNSTKNRRVTVLPFTSIAPMKTMHQDVCSLILERSVAFVIVPFPRKDSMAELGTRDLVPLVVEQASCSVGIMVYHSTTRIMTSDSWQYHVSVLFWGGPDDREAIAIASRAACHPSVYLNVFRLRITGDASNRSQKNGNKEKSPDNEVIDELQKTNAENDRVTLEEITMGDMEQALSFIHNLGDKYNLLIVGRRQESLLMLGEDLEKWTESPELGVIGDILATDVSCKANVLIVQQHK
ncbi:hypothetical protein LUZ60_000030 [Juncus effusus]|nr:hypothetical protein LUZ60_000030 [Juncus effusus]